MRTYLDREDHAKLNSISTGVLILLATEDQRMMRAIDNDLLSGEKVIFRTRKSLIIFATPVFLLLFSFYATYYMHANPILVKVQWAPWFITLIYWLYVGLEYHTAQYVITNKRILMREGFFNRHATELRLATVSQVNVDQSFLGQILDYGIVSINAFGVFDAYTLISKPLIFQKMVNEQSENTNT